MMLNWAGVIYLREAHVWQGVANLPHMCHTLMKHRIYVGNRKNRQLHHKK